MAISDMKGTVTTTGMMNQPSKMPQGNVDPKLPQPKSITQTTQEPVVNTQNTTTVQAPTDEMMDNFTVGLGYSYDVWKGLHVEPNYSVGLKEDENGEREGSFNLGLSYKF